MVKTQEPKVCIVGADDLSPAQTNAVLEGAASTVPDMAVLDVKGPGVVQCIQGLLTNDVEAAGAAGFVYGAVLTNKGMIIADMWAGRQDGTMQLFPMRGGLEPLTEVFKRFLPPRLARVTNSTENVRALALLGPLTYDRLTLGGVSLPKSGQCLPATIGDAQGTVFRPVRDAPFAALVTTAARDAERLDNALATLGIERVPPAGWDLARVVMGWPRLGAEIDEKTIPQEVRFEENEGVSYSKGCYTGQETVARVHFRGHTNRYLAGLSWSGEPDPTSRDIARQGKSVGRVTSIAWLPQRKAFVGLGLVRREVAIGDALIAAGAPAQTVELPL